jgi:hypothetical protein
MGDAAKNHSQEFIDSWPNVSEHVVNESEPAQEAGDQGGQWVDAYGTEFNPEIHATDKDGNPSKTPKGRFRKKPKKKGTYEGGSGPGVDLSATKRVQGDEAQAQAEIEAGALQAAEMTVNLQVLMAMYVGGDEWKPGKDEFGRNEYKSGVEAYKQCYIAYDVNYLPPWLPPCLWTMGFFGRRIMQDRQAQGKIKLFFQWVKSKFSRKRKKNKEKEDA